MIPHHFLNYPAMNPYLMNNPYYNPYMAPSFIPAPFSYPTAPMYQHPNPNHMVNNQDPRPNSEQNVRSIKPVPKTIKKTEKKTEDVDQYRTKVQNSQRNIMSNIAHHLMSYLRKSSKIRPILERIIDIHKLQITPEDFFEFISKIELKNYIRLKVLKQEWTTQKNGEGMAKALRIMVYYFLNQKYFLWIQCSRKIKAQVKAFHMNKRRDFMKVVKNGK